MAWHHLRVELYSFHPETANLRKKNIYLAENLRNLAFGMSVWGRCVLGAAGVAGGWYLNGIWLPSGGSSCGMPINNLRGTCAENCPALFLG